MDTLSWVALGVLFFVFVTLMYGLVALHDIPYMIAKARNHPHQAAIQAGGWVSLFTLHAIWPLLWIWAYSYDPQTGYAGRENTRNSDVDPMNAPDRRRPTVEAQLASGQSAQRNDS